MFIKGNDGNLTRQEADIVDQVLDSQVLHDMAAEFVDRVLRNASVDIRSDIPITTWHSIWEEDEDVDLDTELEITKTLKVWIGLNLERQIE